MKKNNLPSRDGKGCPAESKNVIPTCGTLSKHGTNLCEHEIPMRYPSFTKPLFRFHSVLGGTSRAQNTWGPQKHPETACSGACHLAPVSTWSAPRSTGPRGLGETDDAQGAQELPQTHHPQEGGGDGQGCLSMQDSGQEGRNRKTRCEARNHLWLSFLMCVGGAFVGCFGW